MRKIQSPYIQRIFVGLTVLLLVLGYSLILRAGFTEVRQVLSFIVASYILLWGGYSLISAAPRDEIRTRFVLMTLSLGVALFLAEVPGWLKWIDYRKTFSTGEFLWEQPGYIPDLELLARPEPHHTATVLFDRGNLADSLCLPPHDAEPFQLRYDQNGFRNGQDLAHADIAVIGDSYVESQMMPDPILATTQLQALTGMTVANLGQSGYGPQQELVVLKRYALPLQPHDVVWVFYEGNDLVDAHEYANQVALLKSKLNSMEMVWDRSFTKNALSWFVRTVHGCVHPPAVPAVPATVLDDAGRESRVYVKGRSTSVSLTKQDLDALEKFVAVMEEAYRLTENEGARLLVVFAPTAHRVYHGIARFEQEGEGSAPPWHIDDLPDRLRRMIAAISPNIGYLDLTPALKAAAKEQHVVFLPDDTHWSSDGHRVVAEAIAHALTFGPNVAGFDHPSATRLKKNAFLSEEAIMIRDADGTIRYWSPGAQKLYGWGAEDALGRTSHGLLETVFPAPFTVIEEEVRTKGYWEGQLIHKRRDGSKIEVVSHWDLQQNPTSQGQSMTIIEVNKPSKS